MTRPTRRQAATDHARNGCSKHLATLPLKLRQVLMLQLEGFDYQDIADMLGISTDNVGVRLHRARERLKALSQEENDR